MAGGLSSRMGQNKALLRLAGQTLLERALGTLAAAGLPASIAGGAPELACFAPLIPDAQPELGPLSGICSALVACPAPWAVFVSVDLPLLPPALLGTLLDRARKTGAPVTLASLDGFVESFPAVLSRAALGSLTTSLGSAQRSCLSGFRTAAAALGRPLELVPVEAYAQLSANHLHPADWFMNLNTPEDFERGVQLLEWPIA